MQQLPEHFLQYIWQHQRFDFRDLRTTTGEKITIVATGALNTNAGADFSMAKIYLDDLLWVGDVEIHWQSSDWYAHAHNKNPAYNRVVLHVVGNDNVAATLNQKGEKVPTLCISAAMIEPELLSKYAYLGAQKQFIPCYNHFAAAAKEVMPDFLPVLAEKRLRNKAQIIVQELETSKQDWEQVFYQQLAYSLAANVNSAAMLMLAKACPFGLLRKYRTNLYQLEALLFGQAGLLPAQSEDLYPQQLLKEYKYLRQKHQLAPLRVETWQFSRMRPPNFPTVKIAQLAQIIFSREHLWASLLGVKNWREYELFFGVELAAFWNDRYNFTDKKSSILPKRLGKTAIVHLLINTVAPFLYAYGLSTGDGLYQQKAVELWDNLPAENNPIIAEWVKLGQKPANAAQSQALLELKKDYCERLNCINCAVGKRFLGIE